MVDFIKYSKIYLVLSLLVIGAGLFSMFYWGFNYSIDFVGGTNIEYTVDKQVDTQKVRKTVQNMKIEVESVTNNGNSLLIRTKAIDETKEPQIKTTLEKSLSSKLKLLRVETVGPTLGKEMMRKTLIASLLAIVGILLYMTYAFKGFNFALAAVIALLHDFLVVIGSYSLLSHFFQAQVDTLFVTAVLTTMSFSVHDTIVIFDKIREYIRQEGKGDVGRYANRALTETLVRSVNNSMAIIFMLLALTMLGGSTIKFFAATLLIGTITGSYSSPFVATPIVVWLEKRKWK